MLSFANATGNLFNRLGKLGLLIKQFSTYQSSQLPNLIDVSNGVVGQYNQESDIQAIIGDAYIGLLNNATIGSLVQNMAARTINRMVFRDNPQISQTLTSQNILYSINEVIRQMRIMGATVLAQTITISAGSFTGVGNGPVGNGVIVTSNKRPLDGLVLENAFTEKFTISCTNDSYIGGAVLGNESFILNGTGNQDNFFAFDWPLGSNASVSLSAIDGDVSNGSGNVLTNSGFEDWTSGVPDNFVVVVGNNLQEESTIIYGNPPFKSIKLVGDGVTLTEFYQQFSSSSGTNATLSPLTQYACNMFLRRDGTVIPSGVLEVALVDSSGVVIQDEAGNGNLFTVDLTQLTTAFLPFSGSFRMPLILPDAIRIRWRLTTAIGSGNAYLDKFGLGLMTQSYTSGPFVSIFSGSIPFSLSDYAFVQVTNSRGSGGTLNTWQSLFARLFSNYVYSNEILLPSSSVPTISDGLIQ